MAPYSPSCSQSPTRLQLEMTDIELAAFEAHIVATCVDHMQSHWRDKGYRACVSRIKRIKILHQSYIHEYAIHPGNGPRVPQAVHYFEAEDSKDAYLRTARALEWLSKVPASFEDVLGPIGGGLIRRRFFKDHTAPLAFSSVAALERYMNKGRNLLSKLAPPADPIVITDDPLIFTQSDMHASNFGFDECGNMVLMDFGLIGRLPLSFAKYTMQSSEDFISRVADLLCWPENSNIDSMARALIVWMTANPKLGLDNDGWPAPKRSKREGTGV
ncbi:hypothetical protein MSAN_02518600 [Mycena sanguinolenta]|uniref:Aminoglycoside phosphotransferase domain-containing protein n=1 Tax=Mycena sanguinolenta TaxID=230812 RepID=A0A8H6WP39_9AGAR|nr:hypothetical protein MSAN_02518600 [Mycena sanguinolenta]